MTITAMVLGISNASQKNNGVLDFCGEVTGGGGPENNVA